MKNYSNEHELKRRQLWSDAWCSVARADNCVAESSPTKWADNALREFDKRFKQLVNEKEVQPDE